MTAFSQNKESFNSVYTNIDCCYQALCCGPAPAIMWFKLDKQKTAIKHLKPVKHSKFGKQEHRVIKKKGK